MLTRRFLPVGVAVLALALGPARPAAGQAAPFALPPPGRLIDIGGYHLHLWCVGTSSPGRPTVVLSAGGGDFATDWSLVQLPLADSVRVCSYDRPGFGWSDLGPTPHTIRQEAFELRAALTKSGEASPYVLVGHSIGSFVARWFAEAYRAEVAGVMLVDPANANGKLGFRGQWVIPRLLATDRPVPGVRSLSESPPRPLPAAEADACRARADRNARIWRPYDQLRAQAQRYRVWALQHSGCFAAEDNYFAEEMAYFFNRWSATAYPLGDMPLIVVQGTRPRVRPAGLSLDEWKSDSLRLDLSRLSRRGRLVEDSLSGHHVHLDNPGLVFTVLRELLRQLPN
jgi:pimeloyl-ACP methyl ester carboxylesterase